MPLKTDIATLSAACDMAPMCERMRSTEAVDTLPPPSSVVVLLTAPSGTMKERCGAEAGAEGVTAENPSLGNVGSEADAAATAAAVAVWREEGDSSRWAAEGG